jgi:RNA-binding protein
MTELTSAQRKYLRQVGHHLDPLVIIGKQGVTDMVVRAITEVLEHHELVKIRFNEFKDEKRALTDEIERRTGSHVAGMIGHVALLYKQQPDEEKRKIVFP